MPCNMLIAIWTLLNRIELESIPFNKLSIVERRPTIVFELSVTQLGGKIHMAAQTVAALEWNFKNVLNGLPGLRGSRIRGFWALPRRCSMPRKRSCLLAILESLFSDFFVFFVSAFHN